MEGCVALVAVVASVAFGRLPSGIGQEWLQVRSTLASPEMGQVAPLAPFTSLTVLPHGVHGVLVGLCVIGPLPFGDNTHHLSASRSGSPHELNSRPRHPESHDIKWFLTISTGSL